MFLQKISQSLSDFNDPDATYNQLFFSPAFNMTRGGNIWNIGQTLRFTSNFYNYTFENGTTESVQNVAAVRISFDSIDNGQALFDTINPLPSSSLTTETPSTTSTKAVKITTTTSLVGYPTPVVIHRDGFISGYFLPNSSVAVLVMQGFIDPSRKRCRCPSASIRSHSLFSYLFSQIQ